MTRIGRKLPVGMPALIMAAVMIIAVCLVAQPAFAAKAKAKDTYKLYPSEIKTKVLPEKSVTVTVKLVKNKNTVMKNTSFRWDYDKSALEIKGPKGKDSAKGNTVKFTIKRLKNVESAFTLIADSSDSRQHYENDYFFATVPTNLKYYSISFKGSGSLWRYLVKEGGSVKADKIDVMDAEGSKLPRKAYTLKAEKYMGYDAKKGEEIYEPSSFPLKPNPKDTYNKDGEDVSGVAWYHVYAVANKGGGYKGHTDKEEGFIIVGSKSSMNYLVADADFGTEHLRIAENEEPGFRYEYVKGSKVTPVVRVGGKKLRLGKDYTVKYYNMNTYKDSTTFPQKEGKYICFIQGKGSHYGTNPNNYLKIGKENPVKITATTKKTLKAKALKKKAISFNPFKIKNKQGSVRYVIMSSDDPLDMSDTLKSGKITVAKGTKKGTYKIKVMVTDDGVKTPYVYKAKTFTVKVVVK